MGSGSTSVTELLQLIRAGDADSLDQLFAVVYKELHGLAHKVRSDHRGETINTTALVHEVYIKLAGHSDWENRLHFLRTAAKAMRQILVSAARQKMALKRGGNQVNITFEEELHGGPLTSEKVLAIDDALNQLQEVDPRMAQVVECRYFAGLSIEETASALGISDRTVKRDWRTARAFLAEAIKPSTN
ncbi:MAG: sigma-70 family RNA polymerase sigma factor [Rhodothermales bacterium]